MRSILWENVKLKPFNDEGDAGSARALRRRRGHSLLKVTDEGRLLVFGGRSTKTDQYTTDTMGLQFTDGSNAAVGGTCRYIPLNFLCAEPDPISVSVKDTNKIKLGNKAARGSFHSHTTALHGASVFLFGGFASPSPQSPLPYWDQHLYELKLTKLEWHRIRAMPKGDPRRRGHTAVTLEGGMYVFGGWGPEGGWWRNDIDRFDLERHSWQPVPHTGTMEGPSVAFHTAVEHNRRMVVFGGFIDESGLLQDTLGLSLSSASRGAAQQPVVAPLDNNMKALFLRTADPAQLLEGALGEAGPRLCVSNATFTFDLRTKRWQRHYCIGDVPAARALHSATVHDNLMFVVGGEAERCYGDVYVLDMTLWLWTAVPTGKGGPLPPVSGHAAAIAHGCLVVYGGGRHTSYNLCNDGGDDVAKIENVEACFAVPVRHIVAVHAPLSEKLKRSVLRPAPAADPEVPPTTQLLKADPSLRRPQEIDRITSRVLVPKVRNEEKKSRKKTTTQPPFSRILPPFSTQAITQRERDIEEEQRQRRKPRLVSAGTQDSLFERLHSKDVELRKAAVARHEAVFLGSLPQAKEVPADALVDRLFTVAVTRKHHAHMMTMNRTLQTWDEKERKWVPADYAAEEDKLVKQIRRKKAASGGGGGGSAFPADSSGPMGEYDDHCARFYEERKPNNEALVRRNKALFDRHNTSAEGRGGAGGGSSAKKKLTREEMAAFADKFFKKSVADKAERLAAKREKYTSQADPSPHKRSEVQWSQTVQRLQGQK